MSVDNSTKNATTSAHTFTASDQRGLPMPDGLTGNAARGAVFYAANCVGCHGVSGGGDGPRAYFIFPRPRNFLDPATRQLLNRPKLYVGVRDGVVGKEMPAWGKVLDDQAIADVAEYVFQQFVSDP